MSLQWQQAQQALTIWTCVTSTRSFGASKGDSSCSFACKCLEFEGFLLQYLDTSQFAKMYAWRQKVWMQQERTFVFYSFLGASIWYEQIRSSIDWDSWLSIQTYTSAASKHDKHSQQCFVFVQGLSWSLWSPWCSFSWRRPARPSPYCSRWGQNASRSACFKNWLNCPKPISWHSNKKRDSQQSLRRREDWGRVLVARGQTADDALLHEGHAAELSCVPHVS